MKAFAEELDRMDTRTNLGGGDRQFTVPAGTMLGHMIRRASCCYQLIDSA
jgi:hypothetical protein